MAMLKVFFGDHYCADLHESPQGELSLKYCPQWIEENAIPISIRLPVTDAVYGHELIAPFVASFLPEGDALRQRLQRLLHVDAKHDFGLLAAIGRESAGALSFWPVDEQPHAENARYIELNDEEFENWKAYAHQLPLQFPGRKIRLSLAGAQSKTALYFDRKNAAYLPEQGAPTSHILKPAIPGCRPNSAFVELISMRIAREVLGNARVPEADVWKNCYRVRRFDRIPASQRLARLHQEDFCLALGRMPQQKYERRNVQERLLAHCFQLIDQLGQQERILSPAMQRMHLLDQIILNALLHNPDAHLKNHALLYREDGTLEIAPLYDCLCTAGLTFQSNDELAWESTAQGPVVHTRELSLRIGNAEQIDQVGLHDWELFAEECGFTRAFVRRRVKMLAGSVTDQMQAATESVLNEVPAAENAADAVRLGISAQLAKVI